MYATTIATLALAMSLWMTIYAAAEVIRSPVGTPTREFCTLLLFLAVSFLSTLMWGKTLLTFLHG